MATERSADTAGGRTGRVETGRNYIGGVWTESETGRTFEHRNPAHLQEVTGRYQASGPDDTRRAIGSAQAGFAGWRATPPVRRADILRQALGAMAARRDAVAEVLTLENGKTLAESRVEIDAAIREMEFQIGEGMRLYGEIVPSYRPGVLAFSRRVPLGVVAVISPWNFPFNVPARKCVPALMAGNTVVFKPASLTPRVGIEFVRLFEGAGLPPGVLNLVTGSGRDVGDILVTDPRVKALSFTGSTEVGRSIQVKAAANFLRTQLEMGGKNPTVVLADADLEEAATAVVSAAYACAGQWCTSTSRAIVEKAIAPAFTEAVVARVRALRLGDGFGEAVDMGPVCGTAQMDGILGYVEQGKREGARLLTGGSRPADPALAEGCFIEPAVFDRVTPDMTIAQEEIFGPVLCIQEADSFEEAVTLANGVRFGLASSIYTGSLAHALRFVELTDVGLAHVNMPTAFKEPHLPFGGVKESGFGIPEAGQSGLEFFTEHKAAYVRYR